MDRYHFDGHINGEMKGAPKQVLPDMGDVTS